MERFKYDPQVQVFLRAVQKNLCESGDARFDGLDFSQVGGCFRDDVEGVFSG